MKAMNVKLVSYFLLSGLFLVLVVGKGFAQEGTIELEGASGQTHTLTTAELEAASQNLEEEARNEQDPKKRNILQKLADEVKGMTKKSESSDKKKKKVSVKSIGRSLGKGATFVSVKTTKPFINAAGFLTGFFQKQDKNQEAVAFLNFLLAHDADLKDVYKDAGTPEDYIEKLQEKIDEILVLKSAIILQDTLETLGKPVAMDCILSAMGANGQSSAAAIAYLEDMVDLLNINSEEIDVAKLINEHEEFQDIRELVGDFSKEAAQDFLSYPSLEADIDMAAVVGGGRIKLGEAIGAYAGQLYFPKMIVGTISKSLAGVVGTGLVLSDIGFAASASMCLAHKKTKEKVGVEPEVTEFCSYIVNKSAYELSRSRGKGFVAGKKMKVKVNKFIKKTFGKKERQTETINNELM